MATLVKVTHAAMAEGKDPRIEVQRRLLNYRNTIHRKDSSIFDDKEEDQDQASRYHEAQQGHGT